MKFYICGEFSSLVWLFFLVCLFVQKMFFNLEQTCMYVMYVNLYMST